MLRTNRITTMIAAALAGVGVGVVWLPRAFGGHGLVELAVSERPNTTLSVYVASPPAVRALPRVDATWRWLMELVRSVTTG